MLSKIVSTMALKTVKIHVNNFWSRQDSNAQNVFHHFSHILLELFLKFHTAFLLDLWKVVLCFLQCGF